MAFKKAHEVEKAVENPDPAYRVILLYGPDTGLVSERAEILCKNTGVNLADPFSAIRLNAETVAEDKSRLADEAFTVGMFSGQRLVRISGTTRKNLADAVKPILQTILADVWIVIEAGDLAKTSALRTAFEKSKHGLALPCYQDNKEALDKLIREEILSHGLKIGATTMSFLKPFLGGDRMASRNELRKLALYCLNEESVTIDHVLEIVGDASQLDTNDIIDAVAIGDLKELQNNLERTLNSGLSPDMLLIFTLRHFQFLHELKNKMEQSANSARSLMNNARPPIYFARKDSIATALSKWSVAAIERAMERLDNASFDARANPELANSIAGTNLLALTIEAGRRAVRN